jgi:Peroxin-3
MWRRIEEAAVFVQKHRHRVAIGAAAVVAVVVCSAVYYSLSSSNTIEAEDGSKTDRELLAEVVPSRSTSNAVSSSQGATPSRPSLGQHVLLLVKINEEFEMTLEKFIPVLHLKIITIVDITGTIGRIKQLRPNRNNDDGDDNSDTLHTEEQLWEEVKIASFTLVFVTAYAMCSLSLLIRANIHLFAANMSSIVTSPSTILEMAYSHVFDDGLQQLYNIVLPIVTQRLSAWRVKEKLKLEYSELVRMMNEIRNSIEGTGMTQLLHLILISSSYPTYPLSFNKSNALFIYACIVGPNENLSSDPADEKANLLLQQVLPLVTFLNRRDLIILLALFSYGTSSIVLHSPALSLELSVTVSRRYTPSYSERYFFPTIS